MELLNYRGIPDVDNKHRDQMFLRNRSVMNRPSYAQDYDQTDNANELDYLLKNSYQVGEASPSYQTGVGVPPQQHTHWNAIPNRSSFETNDREAQGLYRPLLVPQQPIPQPRQLPISEASTHEVHNKPTPQLAMDSRAPEPVNAPHSLGVPGFSNMTSLVNSNSNIIVPLVENTFVDHHVCHICGKRITRDMSRHTRTHQSVARFTCKFPKSNCKHKSGRFNRPYDFKKHLLNRHFKFDHPEVKSYHNLSDKLEHWGVCPCGIRFSGKAWLEEHILTKNVNKKCPLIEDR